MSNTCEVFSSSPECPIHIFLYCILSHRVLVFIKRPSQVYADVEMFFKFIPKYQPSGEGGTRL